MTANVSNDLAALERSKEWNEAKQQFVGIGCLRAQLDGFRVRLPERLWERVRLYEPFMMCYWPGNWLRSIPQCLWTESIPVLRMEFTRQLPENQFDGLVLRTATSVAADTRQRWTIPVELALRAGFGREHSSVIFTTDEVWLELCESHLWEARFADAMSPNRTA